MGVTHTEQSVNTLQKLEQKKKLTFLIFTAQHHQIISEHSSGTTQTRQSVSTPWVQLTWDNQQTLLGNLNIKNLLTLLENSEKLKTSFWVDGAFDDYI